VASESRRASTERHREEPGDVPSHGKGLGAGQELGSGEERMRGGQIKAREPSGGCISHRWSLHVRDTSGDSYLAWLVAQFLINVKRRINRRMLSPGR
jgi:hypothetical protein